MPLSSKTETEVGYVQSPGTKIDLKIVRDGKGGQEVRVYMTSSDARVSTALAVLNRQRFGDLKALIAAADAELSKVSDICPGCNMPVHEPEFAEARAPCPHCGRMRKRF